MTPARYWPEVTLAGTVAVKGTSTLASAGTAMVRGRPLSQHAGPMHGWPWPTMV